MQPRYRLILIICVALLRVTLMLTHAHPSQAAVASTNAPASTGDAGTDDSGPDDAGPWSLHPHPTPTPGLAPRLASAKPAPGTPLTIKRDEAGQFHLIAEVNGRPLNFLVDTGADMVALTKNDAEQIGLSLRPDDFRPAIRSASGTGMGAQVTLDRLSVGGTTMDRVPAMVVEGLGQNLLGQSALRQLGRVELNGDVMVITPR